MAKKVIIIILELKAIQERTQGKQRKLTKAHQYHNIEIEKEHHRL